MHPISDIYPCEHYYIMSNLQVGVPNSCQNFLRHTQPFDSGPIVYHYGAVLWCITSCVHELCICGRFNCQGDSTLDYKSIWRQSYQLCAIGVDRFLECEPNGPVAALRGHANLIPFAAVVGWTQQRHDSIAGYQHATHADILYGHRTGAVR